MQTTKTSASYITINHLYILSHPSIHKNPLPGGFLCFMRTFAQKTAADPAKKRFGIGRAFFIL
jgi:hypothetical protein